MTAALETDRLSFAYGDRPILRDVTVHVAPGEVLGVIGPNGSGKTTLVRLMSGVLSPTAGAVRLGGRPLAAFRRRELARRLAVVPQVPVLEFPFTALEVVLMGRAPHLPRLGFPRARDVAIARDAMAVLEVTDVEHRPLDRLSGGERQRVLLARALAQEPEVLLLDEPTTHLDLRHQAGSHDAVRALGRSRATAVVSVLHDLNLAALFCDRLVLLSDGQVVASGAPDAVLVPEVVRAAYRTDVWVGRNTVTGTPLVVPLPRS